MKYEFGALVTALRCDTIDITTPGDKHRQLVPGRYSFNIGGLDVPVRSRDDLPPPGTQVLVTVEWGDR